MPKFRLAAPAEAQLAKILTDSRQGWGEVGRDRYAALLLALMQDVADEPDRPGSRRIDGELRVYHIRYSRRRVTDPAGSVRRPRHLLVCERASDGVVDILAYSTTEFRSTSVSGVFSTAGSDEVLPAKT